MQTWSPFFPPIKAHNPEQEIPSNQANWNTEFVSSCPFSGPVILKYKLLVNKDVQICNRQHHFISSH